jgi:hypothetical protein
MFCRSLGYLPALLLAASRFGESPSESLVPIPPSSATNLT